MANNYFDEAKNAAGSGAWPALKGAYHWFMSKPYLGGNSDRPFVPLTGTAPSPSKAGIGLFDTVKRAKDAMVSLGPVVKTVGGVRYYKNAAGELKTALEMAKEIKAARDALKLEEISKMSNTSDRRRAVWEMNNPNKVRRTESYIDKTRVDLDNIKNELVTTIRKHNFGRASK